MTENSVNQKGQKLEDVLSKKDIDKIRNGKAWIFKKIFNKEEQHYANGLLREYYNVS